jgi:hypothetical protein
MDNNDNDERTMEDIIARGTNVVATYNDEECNLHQITTLG